MKARIVEGREGGEEPGSELRLGREKKLTHIVYYKYQQRSLQR